MLLTIKTRAWIVVLVLAACLQPLTASPSGKELLAALLQGDTSAARRLLKSGAPVNAADEFGSSVLMYAAIYSDAAMMRLLLSRGADPNAANQAGATALMWSISDPAKVHLLISHGANVNAVSTATGCTPLLIAAGRPNSARVVKMLLDKGANPASRDKEGATTVIRAAFDGDPETMRMLIARGVDVNTRAGYNTALADAVNGNHPALVQLLLDSGANPTPSDDLIPVLVNATSYANINMFRKLIAKGASPIYSNNLVGGNIIMSAAASDTSNTEVINELVKLGADPKSRTTNLHIAHGYGTGSESVLDWASRQGETPVAVQLASLTGERVRSEQPNAPPRLGAATPRDAISKALPPLFNGGRDFFKRSGCTSCHHNMIQSLAYSIARNKGVAVNADEVRNNNQQLVAFLSGSREGLLQDVDLPGADTTSGYLLLALEADGHKRDLATDAVVHRLTASQSLDGGFQVRADRPPIESGRVTPTALCIHALRSYPIPGRRAEFDARIRRAGNWIKAYTPRTGEEKSMRLLGMSWAGMDAAVLRDASAALAAEQRPDGGWAQLTTLPSDAYATGQALYALHISGQLSRASLEKAVKFLLGTQLADGTWHIRSRAYPLQLRYVDTGFPHGRDQWISAAATAWACIGLGLAVQ